MENCETREEAVRRIVTLSCTGREKYGLAFDAGEEFGREAALREACASITAVDFVALSRELRIRKPHEPTADEGIIEGLLAARRTIAALIPVAGKEEKA